MSSIMAHSLASVPSYRELEETSIPCDSSLLEMSENERRLQKLSIFILFIASAFGVAMPLLPKYSNRLVQRPFLIVIGKCAGTGVMLACSLVHMILPSTEALTNECLPTVFSSTYPAFSYAFAVLAALFSHLTEFLLFDFISGRKNEENQITTIEGNNNDADCKITNQEDCASVPEPCTKPHVNQEMLNDHLRTKQLTEALLTEFSLSVHSIFVGLGLGVSDGSTLVALLFALIFHQLLEGVALGCRLADSVLGPWTVLLFGFVFSISCPVGVVIGISVHNFLNPNAESLLLIQGIFDGICGGLLLYMGFQLLLVDFHQDLEKYCKGKYRNRMVAGMFVALWLSAFAMSLIGRWA